MPCPLKTIEVWIPQMPLRGLTSYLRRTLLPQHNIARHLVREDNLDHQRLVASNSLVMIEKVVAEIAARKI